MGVHKTSSEFDYYDYPSSKSVWACASLRVWVDDNCETKNHKSALIVKCSRAALQPFDPFVSFALSGAAEDLNRFLVGSKTTSEPHNRNQ